MRVHFIAIGGSAMHNLAIALHRKGYQVSGSDDQIFDPSRSRLAENGLLPKTMGWNVENITNDIDVIILGMHAREDNPELKKAQDFGMKIYSYPEYLYEQTKNKKRVVIGGSHGKTTITSMILHVLNFHNKKFDYMVGALLDGFDCMVGLSEDTDIAIFEGDEYLSSPIDRRPKFHHYYPDIALISGIAWDHINVFPTFENYVEQFKIFINSITPGGTLIFNENDEVLDDLAEAATIEGIKFPYSAHPNRIEKGITYLETETGEVPMQIFGEHNMQNLNGARLVCNQIGINDEAFYKAMQSYSGAAKRLEKLASSSDTYVFKDYAHSPSKLKATTEATKKQFDGFRLIACMELHTFSSLNKDFLSQYENAMMYADEAFIYYNPAVLLHKKLPEISPEEVCNAFGEGNITVFTDSNKLIAQLEQEELHKTVVLLMSSGNFNGVNLNNFAESLISKNA